MRITPRYLVTQDEAAFISIDDCEPFYEDESEWQIDRHEVSVDGRLVANAASWDLTRLTNVSPSYYGPSGGAPCRPSDRRSGDVHQLPGHRGRRASDDDAGTQSFMIQPDGFVSTERNHLTCNQDPDCEARISAYISQSLIRPGL